LIRAVVDTNVFVSGIFWKGTPMQVIEAWIDGKFKLIVTSEILLEYERVLESLGKKAKFSNYDRILELVKLNAEMANPVAFTRPICRDKDDDKFLAAALGGSAQYIVTGDDDLLVLDGHQALKILKPKNFLDVLN
jgi:putative PIN family toxin of toxin-antitoxin system